MNIFKKFADWKEKSKQKSGKIKSLEKKIIALEKSRDQWKSKAVSYKQSVDILNDELKKN